MFPAASNATLLACPSDTPRKIRFKDPSGLRHCTAPFSSAGSREPSGPTEPGGSASSATNTSLAVGGGPFETVTVTVADVRVLPAASRAMARRVWVEPLAAVVVSHGIAYGAVVSSVPR